ncbi:asparagine synthase (glutamine-hydrolyzing) [soil metagenome]
MCGFAGYFERGGLNGSEAGPSLQAMTDAIVHRGPDDAGAWFDADAGIALGHRRLSIIDLSPLGHQPMFSACGRYAVIFNGEIYNFQELGRDLAGRGHQFRGHSDTEVLLAAVVEWGVRGALERFNGMFAFAIWDREERALFLARDRAGEKPLYYGWMGRSFLFGSELKALMAHPDFRGEIDRDAVALYLRHNYVPAPYCIFRGLHKLPAGSLLRLDEDGAAAPEAYWSFREVAERGMREPFAGSFPEAVDRLDELLLDAVKLRMVADVPLGAFLSGGVDSSVVVALMQAQSTRPVKTFTIGFHEGLYNEAEYAKAVATHLGTDHTELYVTPEEAMQVIPRIPALYDEPFSDSSQIPTFLVSQLARQHVTVSLSGDAGDELFGGYNRYFWARRIWNKIGWVPAPFRRAAAAPIRAIPAPVSDAVVSRMRGILPARIGEKSLGNRVRQAAEILGVRNPEEMYSWLVSHWKNPERVVRGGVERPTVLSQRELWADLPDFTHRMMYLDSMMYLPDDILVKVDRAAMGVSLESRVPLLDPRIIEFAWRLPLGMKVGETSGKKVLREVLFRYVPRELIERPKMGFGVPIDSWLRGPLRGWADDLLDPSRLRTEGIFNPEPIQEKWKEHLSGRADWHYYLWDILVLQMWKDYYAVGSGAPLQRPERLRMVEPTPT